MKLPEVKSCSICCAEVTLHNFNSASCIHIARSCRFNEKNDSLFERIRKTSSKRGDHSSLQHEILSLCTGMVNSDESTTCKSSLCFSLSVKILLCKLNDILQRARLVLKAKGIEYDCVNINLKDRPDWFYELNPLGKVPVIEMPDGKVLYESAICCGELKW